MEILNSIALGIIQGITEFLPISSSGHLIIFRDLELFSKIGSDDLAYDAILQLATTFSVLIYFRKNILQLFKGFIGFFYNKNNTKFFEEDIYQKKMVLAIICGTIPIIFIGLFLENYMETIFRSSKVVLLGLIFGSVLMLVGENYHAKNINKKDSLSKSDGFIIGFFQSLALIPGMSRSGMTISGGFFSGLDRELAVRFSFLLSIPILLITGLKKLIDLITEGKIYLVGTELIVGSITAFIAGLLAIHFLINFLKKYSLKIFVIYRIFLAIILFIFIYILK